MYSTVPNKHSYLNNRSYRKFPLKTLSLATQISVPIRKFLKRYLPLKRALRALASSSGGAACPGATRGQPQESG